ncbi:MAG: transcription-repair coupling factor [Actinomycetes bacterium]
MALSFVIEAVTRDEQIRHAIEQVEAGAPTRLGVAQSTIPYVVAALAQSTRPVLIITASDKAADQLAVTLRDFVSPETLAVFPAWETLPHERLSPSGDTVGTRMTVLRRLAHPDGQPIRVLVAPIRAVIQPIVQGLGEIVPLTVSVGDYVSIHSLSTSLVNLGFERVDLVDRRGQFAVRGGIVDVFPSAQEHPVRVEFWDDTVDDIRVFSVADQRSLGLPTTTLQATACRELLITDDVRLRARELIVKHPELSEILSKIAEGIAAEGMEALIPVLTGELELLLDTIGPDWLVIEVEPERIATRASELVTTSAEFLEASWHNASDGNVMPIDLGRSGYREYDDVKLMYGGRRWCELSTLIGPEDSVPALETIREYRSALDDVVSDVRGHWGAGNAVIFAMAGAGSAQRVVQTLSEHDVPARIVDNPVGATGIVEVTIAHQLHGVSGHGVALFTEVDLFAVRDSGREPRSLPSRRKAMIDPLSLKAGDYIVHDQHGVGRYVEMQQRTVQGATREYLVVEYSASKRGQRGDRLYIPTDQLDHVTRYVGGEAPSLNRLGGSDWAATKSRARKAVRQIAGELIRLYAARMASKGYAFAQDTPWQRELEDAFEHVETPDQLITINDVKADMERDIPMDRLVCGDVGYGKTEIAVRAAFKAVQDGKQVAVLVPTTLLVQQHMETFARRYAQFPVKLGALSRFQTGSETKAVLEGMSDGTIDIVIGTHRLFNPDVRFKDLGLVIVDEEQRFGVEHKEHLKALRTNVDMLTMSATPIPRTLEMAVTGLREMSTIQTPPEERHPILTSVGPYDEKFITAAIHRELLRDGQVFFVHNRVESINRVASRLRDLVPEARIAVAHGQMNEHELEQIIVDFWEHKFDVLVSTTIIESGLDIPNANTLIVDRAENFGLSQLHQLRGRVGRSRERGYAYFLYSPDKPLTEHAHDRLATIAAHTDLGSGIAVAMKDLEIRGSGNLLGGEQSGHIAEVGFDLYIRLVSEAISEVRNEGTTAATEMNVKVELPIDAHIPHNYVPEERLRLEAYRRLADAHTTDAIDEAVAEFADRYGLLPTPVAALISVARLRAMLHTVGVEEVIATSHSVRIFPVELAQSRQLRLSRLYPGTKILPATRTIVVPRPKVAMLGAPTGSSPDGDLVEWVSQLVQAVLIAS